MGKEGQGDVGCVTINLPDPPTKYSYDPPFICSQFYIVPPLLTSVGDD